MPSSFSAAMRKCPFASVMIFFPKRAEATGRPVPTSMTTPSTDGAVVCIFGTHPVTSNAAVLMEDNSFFSFPVLFPGTSILHFLACLLFFLMLLPFSLINSGHYTGIWDKNSPVKSLSALLYWIILFSSTVTEEERPTATSLATRMLRGMSYPHS